MEPHIEFMRSPSSPNLKPGYADKEVLRLARSLGPPASKHQGRVALLVAGVHVGVLRPKITDQTKLISLGLTDLLQRKELGTPRDVRRTAITLQKTCARRLMLRAAPK